MSWGANPDGQLGNGAGSDSALYGGVANLTGVSQVRPGGIHSPGADLGRDVWAWGDGNEGQLGNGSTAESPVLPNKCRA